MKILVPVFIVFTLIFHAHGLVCPRGFQLVNQQKCLTVFDSNTKHFEAESDCVSMGGTLVTVKNAVDNRAVANLASMANAKTIWLGIYCFENVTSTPCYHDDNSGIVNYNSFAPGHPQVQGHQGCVYMIPSSGQWLSAPCETIGMPYMCEVPPTLPDPTCNHNYNGYCYMPSHEIPNVTTNTTYSEAQHVCRSQDGSLVSIHSKMEIDYVRILYKDSGIPQIFLGADAYITDQFAWIDLTNWDYAYMNPIDGVKKDCLSMDLSTKPNSGTWYQTSCQDSQYFLCKRKLGDGFKRKKRGAVDTTPMPRQLDNSNCNTTLLMAPGAITSYGYITMSPPITNCTWTVATLGPYRIAMYFTYFNEYSPVYIHDQYDKLVASPSSTQRPFEVLGAGNILKISDNSFYEQGFNFNGFYATILPY